MITRQTLTNYLHDYLACDQFTDYAPNGLQVEGRESIRRICTAVSASENAIQQAVSLNADALLVHHGYFWRGEASEICGIKKRRVAELLKHDINLFAYHLPLDCHVDVGNNACLAELFAIHSVESHTVGKTPNLIWRGALPAPLPPYDFAALVKDKLNREPQAIVVGEKLICEIAWCTGAAQDYIHIAHELGVDAYLSGEVSERTYYQAHELGLHYFAGGHHATERYGIQALGQHLAVQFSLHHHFIDSQNPI